MAKHSGWTLWDVEDLSREVRALPGGDPVDTGEVLHIRLGGRQFSEPLFELALEALPPDDLDVPAIPWRGIVGVVSPLPHQGTSVILGQIGFSSQLHRHLRPRAFRC